MLPPFCCCLRSCNVLHDKQIKVYGWHSPEQISAFMLLYCCWFPKRLFSENAAIGLIHRALKILLHHKHSGILFWVIIICQMSKACLPLWSPQRASHVAWLPMPLEILIQLPYFRSPFGWVFVDQEVVDPGRRGGIDCNKSFIINISRMWLFMQIHHRNLISKRSKSRIEWRREKPNRERIGGIRSNHNESIRDIFCFRNKPHHMFLSLLSASSPAKSDARITLLFSCLLVLRSSTHILPSCILARTECRDERRKKEESSRLLFISHHLSSSEAKTKNRRKKVSRYVFLRSSVRFG